MYRNHILQNTAGECSLFVSFCCDGEYLSYRFYTIYLDKLTQVGPSKDHREHIAGNPSALSLIFQLISTPIFHCWDSFRSLFSTETPGNQKDGILRFFTVEWQDPSLPIDTSSDVLPRDICLLSGAQFPRGIYSLFFREKPRRRYLSHGVFLRGIGLGKSGGEKVGKRGKIQKKIPPQLTGNKCCHFLASPSVFGRFASTGGRTRTWNNKEKNV